MSDVIFVGNKAQNIYAGASVPKITRVNLVVDPDHMYTVGNDTGRTIEVECPWGTQAMASNILANLSGIEYAPYTAERTLLDPAFEIGDAVRIGGVYSLIATADCNYNGASLMTIGAPDLDEIDDEYPAQQTKSNSIKRSLAYTRSLITKTAEQIRMEVQGVEEAISYIEVDLEAITSRVQDAEGNIATLELTATNLRSEISGKIDSDYAQTLIDQSLEEIELSVSSNNGSTTFRITANGTTLSSKTLDLTVDAVNISGTLTAAALIGGEVQLLTSAERAAGGLAITGASTSTYAIELYSKGALRLEAYSGAAYLGAGDAYIHVQEGGTTISNGTVGIDIDDHVWVSSNLFPLRADRYMCGNANFPWSAVWSTNGMCETSDRKKKKDIEYGLDRFDGFFDDLRASSYRMVNGTSGRRHNGFISNDVKANLDKHGISTADFGGYVADQDADGNPIYALRYSEFIPLLVEQVQKLKARVAQLEGKKHEV